jgi:hypothetical protein
VRVRGGGGLRREERVAMVEIRWMVWVA